MFASPHIDTLSVEILWLDDWGHEVRSHSTRTGYLIVAEDCNKWLFKTHNANDLPNKSAVYIQHS